MDTPSDNDSFFLGWGGGGQFHLAWKSVIAQTVPPPPPFPSKIFKNNNNFQKNLYRASRFSPVSCYLEPHLPKS